MEVAVLFYVSVCAGDLFLGPEEERGGVEGVGCIDDLKHIGPKFGGDDGAGIAFDDADFDRIVVAVEGGLRI